jgi:hypothetical protein
MREGLAFARRQLAIGNWQEVRGRTPRFSWPGQAMGFDAVSSFAHRPPHSLLGLELVGCLGDDG